MLGKNELIFLKFRMASVESRKETTQQKKTPKTRAFHKMKTKRDSKETENSLQTGTIRRALNNSFSRLRRSSKNVTVEIKDAADGGPLDCYPMDKGGQLYIIRMY